MTSSRENGATTLAYNAADPVVTNTAPAPAAGQSAPVTVFFYDTSLGQTGQRLPDGAVVTNAFLANGLMQKTWGDHPALRIWPAALSTPCIGWPSSPAANTNPLSL